jgi:hypothetical protein
MHNNPVLHDHVYRADVKQYCFYINFHMSTSKIFVRYYDSRQHLR